MTNQTHDLLRRIEILEARYRRLWYGVALALCLTAVLGVWTSQPEAPQPPGPLRVRELIVEDAAGQARIVLGAPMSNSEGRIGMRVNDAGGAERLGLSLQRNGSMVLGFDAPLGAGDDRNRERITLVADQNGGAHIRFLDRRTSVVARMYLDEQNKVWVEFSDYAQQPPVRRRLGLSGEERLTQ